MWDRVPTVADVTERVERDRAPKAERLAAFERLHEERLRSAKAAVVETHSVTSLALREADRVFRTVASHRRG